MKQKEIAKTALIGLISSDIKSRGITQQAAAELLGIDQAQVSRLVNQRADLFKLDSLVDYSEKLGRDVKVKVE